MKLRWLGHSAFELISNNNLNILIDPFIRGNPSCPLKINDLNPDVICITHGHADHFGDAIELARKSDAIVITNYEISIYLQREGINAIGINYGAFVEIQDVKIKMLEAKHSSSFDFNIEGGYAGNPASFLLEFKDDLKIFHAGDTSLFSDMKFVIGEVYKPDIAMLPIGNIFMMDPIDAAIATKWINSKYVIPMHYNSFPSIMHNPESFKSLVKKHAPNCETLIPDVLEFIEF